MCVCRHRVSGVCVCTDTCVCAYFYHFRPPSESTLAVSHAVVLPQDPRASTATPAPAESAGDDWMIAFGGGAETGDVGG